MILVCCYRGFEVICVLCGCKSILLKIQGCHCCQLTYYKYVQGYYKYPCYMLSVVNIFLG